jgi:type I restriction enzyme S subunit
LVRAIEAQLRPVLNVEQELCSAEKQLDRLAEKLLAKAFRGELVTRDDRDEPVATLLGRIHLRCEEKLDNHRGRRLRRA